MCQSCAEGGRRCRDRRQLEGLTVDELRPSQSEDRPDVVWPDEPVPSTLWDKYPTAVAGEAVATILEACAEESGITTDHLQVLPEGARMHALEFRVKSPSSLTRKILSRLRRDRVVVGEGTARDVAGRLTDVVRYTAVCVDHEDLPATARSMVAALGTRSYSVVEAEHSYVDGNPYKGLHLLVASPAGRVFELQIHSELSQSVKDTLHVDYELERDMDLDWEERAAARERMEKLSASVPTPAGLGELTALGEVPVRARTYPNPYASS
jgi:ppGpp synthetase/RelA/SpoT-type nucleotidyltranferase